MPGRATVLIAVLGALLGSCGGPGATNAKAEERFLDSVYSRAPDIGSYRTGPQLLSLGQAVCQDLESGASVQEVGDRVPLVEGNVLLPPADLGVVISAAVAVLCPRFRKLLS